MSSIKKLAGQTIWYGASSIIARFLFYLLTPYFTLKLSLTGYGDMSILYAAIPFLNILFTYGLETAYFRFATRHEGREDIYNTAIISIITSTIVFTVMLIFFRQSIAHWLRLDAHPEWILFAALIIGFDTLAVLPFAKLRLDQRPAKYALIRVSAIVLQIGLTYFFLSVCPQWAAQDPYGVTATFYDPNYGVGYIIISNLLASAFAWLLLNKEFFDFTWRFSRSQWAAMMLYSLPLIIAGLGGMINETFDRIMLSWLAPAEGIQAAKSQVAIYSACYKLSILITLFVQAFRMGAEPFFFREAVGQHPQKVYARVMKFFVITITVMFLVVALYLDIWKYFLSFDAEKRAIYTTGLKVVPILLFANIFLGIYYNLSIWYKVKDRTIAGAVITIVGAALTLGINFIFIPVYGYMACAWATFFCYGSMMVISYLWGQKSYPVPYPWKKLLSYMVIVVLLYFIHWGISSLVDAVWFNLALGTVLILTYLWFLLMVERKEFMRLPVVGKWLVKK